MTRFLRFLVRNWPLKLAALVMAMLLYGGLVVSENAQEFPGRVPIEGLNQPRSVVVLSNLGDVRLVRYYAPDSPGIRLDSSYFRATVDLSSVDPRAGVVSVPVKVVAIDPRIQVLEYEPSRINVELDEVLTRSVPVQVDYGTAPNGLDVRVPVVETTSVAVAGPASLVRRVVAAEARLRIDPSGLDIDRDVELVAVDQLGDVLTPVDISPSSVRVRIAIFTNRDTRSLPVSPIINGVPAAGFEIASVTVDPPVVSVEGDADQLTALTRLDTVPVSIAGASGTVSVVTSLSLPTGVLPLGTPTVTVRVAMRQVSATRTLNAGIVLVGARSDLTYSLSVDRVLVTLGGTTQDLDRVSGASFTVSLDVTGLAPGSKSVLVAMTLPTGVTLVAVNPQVVTVTASQPAQAATPGASPSSATSGSPSPGGSPPPSASPT